MFALESKRPMMDTDSCRQHPDMRTSLADQVAAEAWVLAQLLSYREAAYGEQIESAAAAQPAVTLTAELEAKNSLGTKEFVLRERRSQPTKVTRGLTSLGPAVVRRRARRERWRQAAEASNLFKVWEAFE